MFLNLLLLLDFDFDTYQWSVIFDRIIGYIRSGNDFRYVLRKYNYDKSGRGKIPNIFNTMELSTSLCSSWP